MWYLESKNRHLKDLEELKQGYGFLKHISVQPPTYKSASIRTIDFVDFDQYLVIGSGDQRRIVLGV